MTSKKFRKSHSEPRSYLRAIEKDTESGECQKALDNLFRFERKFSALPKAQQSVLRDRYADTYFRFADVCVRTKKARWDPEDGTRADMLEWQKGVKKSQSVWRDKGLEGRRRRK